ncbi:MAG: CinA family nicotinamide mononucleotide deamidase-related protein [Desulfatiglandaceae bacterium]
MRCEIITIGNELISGRTLDLNAWYAAEKLTAAGLQVTRITSIGDDCDQVSETLENALKMSQFIIVTGGLGSTDDDLTNEIVAKVLNRPLCLDREMFELIRRHASMQGVAMNPFLEKMAWLPDGSKMLSPEGKACGFSLVENEARLYFLPGVPEQMRYLIDRIVIPEIRSHCERLPVTRELTLKVFGLSEPRIAEIFEDLRGRTGKALLGFYPHFPENHITVTLTDRDHHVVALEMERIEKAIRDRIGPYIFACGNGSMAEAVGQVLKRRKWTLSVAESCTGGLVGHLLTAVPGSSSYFLGGIISYSNQAKIDVLRVSPGTLQSAGAVSDETVREMAEGVRQKLKTDLGIAISGIAGPEGGSQEKPVGTVHLGMATVEETFTRKYCFMGSRRQIKRVSAMMALDWLRRYCNGDPFLPGL